MTYFFLAILLGPILSIPEIVTLRYLWIWFVAPTFSMPVPTFLTLMGLSMVMSVLTGRVRLDPEATDDKQKLYRIRQVGMFLFVRPLVIFLAGWLIHSIAR